MNRVLCFLLISLLLIASAACAQQQPEPSATPAAPVEATPAPTPTPTPAATPEVYSIRDGFSPTTGLPWVGDYKPIAVVIENSAAARPLSGISQADWVYEIFVEGKITRFLAIFNDHLPEKVGPVRSARVNLLDIQQEWGAAFIHYGASMGGDSTTCAAPRIPTLEFPFRADGVSGLNGKTFWRDKNRNAPHNAYNNLVEVSKMFEAGIAPVPRNFCETVMDGGAAGRNLAIKYNASTSYTEYQYDEQSRAYLRSVSGKPFVDKETDNQITVTNIIVQRVEHTSPKVGNYTFQIMDLTGEGKAEFISGARYFTGTWKSDSAKGKTGFYLDNGEEISLLPGNTWVQIVYPDTEVTVS